MLKSFCLAFLLQATPNPDTIELVNSPEILELSAQLSEEEKYDEAIQLLQKVSENDSNYFKVQAQLLSTYNDAGYYDRTKAAGAKLIRKPSANRSEMYISYGNAYLESQELDSAKKIYHRGLGLFPYEEVLFYNLGIAHYRSKEYQSAIDYFQKCLKINPFYSSSHLMLGYISVLQGHRSKALLSYYTYLMLNVSNQGVLVGLENLVDDAVRYEGSIDAVTDNSYFQGYDNLLASKAALDQRFKPKVDFNASVVRQSELLLSRLKYDESSDDFWNQFYLPIYTQIEQQGLTSALIYFLLSSTGDEDILGWISKNEKQKGQWIDIANREMARYRSSSEAEVLGVKDTYSFWYYNSNALSAIGNQLSDEHRIGPWIFFYENAQKSTEGFYNQEGKKIGNWKYYYNDGSLSREEVYDDAGSLVEPVRYYRRNGSLSVTASYREDQVDGFVEFFYDCSTLKERNPYRMGVNEGAGEYFYETGEKKIDYELKEGDLTGDYKIYYRNGKLHYLYTYLNDKKNGPYIEYRPDGKIAEKGAFKDDVSEGEWIGYFKNDQVSHQGKVLNDKKVGEWNYYYEDGKLRQKEYYNEEGELDGVSHFYHQDGFLMTTNTFDKGVLVGYQVFDRKGNLLGGANDPAGNMPLKSFYWTGIPRNEGTLQGGKINGPYKVFSAKGNLWREGTMKDDSWDGDFTEYYPSGKVAIKCTYEAGDLNGYYVKYYKNGQKEAEGYYLNNIAEQTWKYYYPDGSLKQECYYNDGQYHGEVIDYAVDQKVWGVTVYDQGVPTAYTVYDTLGKPRYQIDAPFGSAKYTTHYQNGRKSYETELSCGYFVADRISYYPGGGVITKTSVENGEYAGEYIYLNPLGKTLVKGNYQQNMAEGLWQYYTDAGQLSLQRNYEEDLLEGGATRFYENGQPEVTYTYLRGDLHGPSVYYDWSGNIQVVKHYDQEIGFYGYQYLQANGTRSDTIPYRGEDTEIVTTFPNGNKAFVQNFANGFFHGTNLYYASNGALIEQSDFQQGDNHGQHLKYYPNGKLKYKATYRDDLLEGMEYEYYENGSVRKSTEYKMGGKNGYEKGYSPEGKLTWSIYYWNGDIYE